MLEVGKSLACTGFDIPDCPKNEIMVFPPRNKASIRQTSLKKLGTRLRIVTGGPFTRNRGRKRVFQASVAHQIPHYLPLVQKTYVSCGRKFTARVPLFPGYVFMLGSEQERVCSLTSKRVSRSCPSTTRVVCGADLQTVIAINYCPSHR